MLKIFCLILVLFATNITWAGSNCDNEKINHHLNRANSLFWLSRNRQNSLFEAIQSKTHLDSVLLLLKSEAIEPECINYYLELVNSVNKVLDELISVTGDNLNGNYPLIPFINDDYEQFEYYDDPIETATEKALSVLLESAIYKPSKELKDVLLFCVVEVEGNPALKEVAIQYLNIHSKMYVISDYEIFRALNGESLDSDSSLIELGHYFGTNYIGRIVIKEYDNSDEISYAAARFEFYNLMDDELISNTYAEGIKVNMKGKIIGFFQYFSLLVVFVFVALILLFLLYKKISKDSGSFLNFLIALFGGLILGIASSVGMVQLLSLFAPSGGDFIDEPFVMIWPYLLSFGVSLLPVLCFILSGLILKRRLSDSGPLIFVFLSSASIAIVFPVLKAHLMYLELEPANTLIFGYIFSILIISFGSSIWLRNSFKNNSGVIHHIISFVLFIPIGIIYHELLRGGMVHYIEFDIYVSLLSLIFGIIPLILLTNRKDVSVNSISQREMLQIDRFKKLISEQLNDDKNHIIVDFTSGYFELFNKFLIDFTGFRHLHISGSSGIGKTTFIRNFIDKNQDSCISFYGDCDEDQSGTVIPYEPFYQAFSRSVGIGAFYDGGGAASELLTKAKPLLDAAGVGSISESLGSKGQSFDGASVKEILSTIKNHISNVKNAKKVSRILIVIEDLQWIDDYSKDLLLEAFMELNTFTRSKSGKVDILFVTTSSTDITKLEKEKETGILELSFKHSQNDDNYSYCTWNNNDEEILKIDSLADNNFIVKLLSRSNSKLLISPSSVMSINKFIQQSFPVNPRYSLQVVRYLLDNDLIIEDQGVIIVKDDLDWDTIPFENQMEELYFNQFSSLPENVLKILESAAFVGMDFEADLLSKLWKIDRIDLIHNLIKAEKIGLVIDVNNQDDWYRFGSKSIRAALKRFSMTDQIQKGKIPQIVKEYHREIIRITLEKHGVNDDFDNISNLATSTLFQLADRVLIVNNDRPIMGMGICCEAMIRAVSNGDMKKSSSYIAFLNKIPVVEIAKSDKLFSSFLEGVLFEVSSKKEKYFEENGTALIEFLESALLLGHDENSPLFNQKLESYLELCLKTNWQNHNVQLILDKYKSNSYAEFYRILLNRKDNGNRFSDANIADLTSLWTELETKEDNLIKGKVLGNLGLVTTGNEALYYHRERVKLISENCGKKEEIVDIIECLENHLDKFDYNELNDIGFICSGLNNYLNTQDLPGVQFKLNKFRLNVNIRLNHSIGIFVSSMEMMKHPSEFVTDELFQFAQNLFFNYPEGSFRSQLYPLWLKNTLLANNKELMMELGVATQIMMKSVHSETFMPSSVRNQIYLPEELIKELLSNPKLNATDEKNVIETLITFCN